LPVVVDMEIPFRLGITGIERGAPQSVA